MLSDPETLSPFTPAAHLDVESCPVCDLTDAVSCSACNAKGVLVVIRRDPPAIDHLTLVLSR